MRFAIFVDGSNFGAALKHAGFRVDYNTLLGTFREFGEVVAAYYFTALPPEGEPSAVRTLTETLSRRGWTIKTKPVKTFNNDGRIKVKGDMDVDIVIDAIKLVDTQSITHLVLLSGDGDFTAMVKYVQTKGVQVICISHGANGPDNVMASELRHEVTEFINLHQVREFFERK